VRGAGSADLQGPLDRGSEERLLSLSDKLKEQAPRRGAKHVDANGTAPSSGDYLEGARLFEKETDFLREPIKPINRRARILPYQNVERGKFSRVSRDIS
jgi:hypothetical protein